MKKLRGIQTVKDAYQWGRQSARIHRATNKGMPLAGAWCLRDDWTDKQKTAFVLGFISKLGVIV